MRRPERKGGVTTKVTKKFQNKNSKDERIDIDELVITLELSRKAKPLLEELIRKWLADRIEKEEMDRFIREKVRNAPAQPEA